MGLPHMSALRHTGQVQAEPVRLWLAAVAVLVFAMIVAGGATRLTGSGLSITEWQPIQGAIPPLSEADWRAAFDKYKEIPEYRLVNRGMSLGEFKVIYWWEWAHRFLGRFIGAAFVLPLAFFWATGQLRRGLAIRLLGILLLGALQGGIGWYMVQSGLVDRVDVSHYRLALHLVVAFLILGLLVWTALSLSPRREANPRLVLGRHRAFAATLVCLVLVQVVLGAFVAGLEAGLVHDTWPLMDGRFVPDGLLALEPWYLNFGENVTTVQFSHRMVAYGMVVLVALHVWSLWRARALEASGVTLAAAALAQAGLGIWTLLAGVPLPLALMHQTGAAALLVAAVWHLRRIASAGLRLDRPGNPIP